MLAISSFIFYPEFRYFLLPEDVHHPAYLAKPAETRPHLDQSA
jgi:hypothetical protein